VGTGVSLEQRGRDGHQQLAGFGIQWTKGSGDMKFNIAIENIPFIVDYSKW
jgi:hypothetical protein